MDDTDGFADLSWPWLILCTLVMVPYWVLACALVLDGVLMNMHYYTTAMLIASLFVIPYMLVKAWRCKI